MGARHALFRPFAAPSTVEILESPRGWYGADRPPQQGRAPISQRALGRDIHCWEGSPYLGRDAVKSRLQRRQALFPSSQRHAGDRNPQSNAAGNPAMPPEPCVTTGPGLVQRMRRAVLRTGGERGGCDAPGRRARRARMSFGLGGIARKLIDPGGRPAAGRSARAAAGQRSRSGWSRCGPETKPDGARLHDALPLPAITICRRGSR